MMKKVVVKVSPNRIIRFVDGFGKRRIFIRGVGSFPEEDVIIEPIQPQKKLSEFIDKYYKIGW